MFPLTVKKAAYLSVSGVCVCVGGGGGGQCFSEAYPKRVPTLIGVEGETTGVGKQGLFPLCT